jgi:hypothetical protein
VQLQEVDVIGVESAQGRLAGPDQKGAGGTRIVRPVP